MTTQNPAIDSAGTIIQAAFEDAGLCSIGQTVSSAQQSRGLYRLQTLINWNATQGLKVWLQEDQPIPLTAGKGTYVIGPGGDVPIARPLQCLQGYYLTSQGVQQPLTVLSRSDYAMLSQVNNQGAISSYFADRQATAMNVNLWNVPDSTAATGTVHLILRISCPNPSSSLDTITFPPEWSIYLRAALAHNVSAGVSKELRDDLAQQAKGFRDALEGFDVEDAPTQFQPDSRTGYGRRSFR